MPRSKSLRVAHVLRKFDPTEWGGTETHVAAVTRHLPAFGWSSEVHAPRLRSDHPTGGAKEGETSVASDVPLRRYRAFCPFLGPREQRQALWANAGNIVSLQEPLRLARDETLSLVHAHTMGRIGAGVRTAMKLTGRPYVISLHGPLFAQRDSLQRDTEARYAGMIDLGRPFGALLGARRVVEDAARVIAFNNDEYRAVAQRVGDRAVRMDHGVDVDLLGSGSAERGRQRWPAFGSAPVVAILGRVASQKNQVFAVGAFAQGAPKDHHLVMAGAATDHGYRERVLRAARDHGVAERVHLLGNIDPDRDVPDLLALCRAVMVPSTHEPFGLCVLEGWAAQRPVLFSDASGPADLALGLRDRSCMASLDEAEWVELLAGVLSSPGKQRALAEDGLRLVRERYTWPAAVQRLAELYETVIGEARR